MGWRQELGKEIANKRRLANMSQDELHTAINISRNTIGLYERGKTSIPCEVLTKIADALATDEFVVEDLHITFSRNGSKAGLEQIPQQLNLGFDEDGGVTVRIESTGQGQGVTIKKMSA